MKVKNLTIHDDAYPYSLRDIAQPPAELFFLGVEPASWMEKPRVAIVGSRHVSAYGKQVTAMLARELASRGVVIVSGLALGVDAVAHQACLEAGGVTVAVLANGLHKVYPTSHIHLAQRILEQGGTLLSEYPLGTPSYPSQFVARNRIVAGLCDALVVTEASERSGTLHTARFALEQGRDVLAVPGNITSPTSQGTNNLLKTGATPVTSVDDILYTLGKQDEQAANMRVRGDTPDEQAILDLLYSGFTDGHEILTRSQLVPTAYNQALTMLEISGKVRPLGNNHWAIV